ncbi:hypothetical protein FEM33_00580 [Dyadobacter flavalbus]|uniref:Uncharacterized protein n=1 Tax=Dyadobacter flavalbus TaxID=2579942 RepID=A0A5M8R000_9BACT|nr:hypothetical protein [Dyadobacter flavalbus]KAA6441799.1 hypothetical protein FEM33_00580 [Dyadobacter flavalbus]
MKKILVITGLIISCILTSSNVWAQCAMCRGTVESSMGNGRNNVGVGLNTGILFLFVMPYLLVAVIGYLWYRNSRRNMQERQFVTSRVKSAFQS